MFGNTLGWILSALLTITVVGSVAHLDRAGRPTAPDAFGLDPASAAPIELADSSTILPQQPDADRAEALYAEALKVVAENRPAFEAYIARGDNEASDRIAAAVAPLIQAAGFSGGVILADRPEQLIHYDQQTPALRDIELLGRSALRAATAIRRVNPAAALAHQRAAFALGRRMVDERITYAQLDLGLQLLAESAAAMKQIARDTADAGLLAQVESFDAQRLMLTKTRVMPIATRIRSADGPTISANLGNVRRWATNPDSDQVWRVEATLAVGRSRFSVGPTGRRADQLAADRALRSLANDPSAEVRFAASQAQHLTPERVRQLR